MKALVRVRVYL